MSRISSWILNCVYAAILLASLPLVLWSAWRHGKYREGFAEKLLGRVPRRSGSGPCVWLHAVSVGEVNLLATLIAELKRHHPSWEIVVSTTTKTGYDLARRKYADHVVFYAPLDFSWAVRTAMQRVRPTMLVLAELELWPNFIRAAKEHSARVAIINGRLSDNSYRGYRRIRPLVARLLRQIDVIAAQNEETAERFAALGAAVDCLHVTGSLKFDGARSDRDNPKTRELRQLAGFADDAIVLLAGSTQAPEEAFAIDLFKQLAPEHPRLRLVLVPRHPERFDEVAQLLDHSGITWQRRSALPPSDSAIRNLQSKILLVDTIGELGAWWGTATIGFVGGSFGSRGGQNMIEPAAYGVATCFGPNTWNFRDVVAQLLAAKAAEVVHSQEEFCRFVRQALEDVEKARQLGENARRLVASQQGATARTVDLLVPLVEQGEVGSVSSGQDRNAA